MILADFLIHSSIIIVTIHTILAHHMINPQPPEKIGLHDQLCRKNNRFSRKK